MKTMVPRKAQRYPLNLPIMEVNGKRVTETYLKDVSTTGFRMEAPSSYPLRGVVEFKILLPGSQKEFILSGQVIWARPSLAAPGRFLMGIKLHIPKWEIESILRTWRV